MWVSGGQTKARLTPPQVEESKPRPPTGKYKQTLIMPTAHTGSENGLIQLTVWLIDKRNQSLIRATHKQCCLCVCTCIGVRSIAQDGDRGSESLATRAALGRWLGSSFGVEATDSLLSPAPILHCLLLKKQHGL